MLLVNMQSRLLLVKGAEQQQLREGRTTFLAPSPDFLGAVGLCDIYCTDMTVVVNERQSRRKRICITL